MLAPLVLAAHAAPNYHMVDPVFTPYFNNGTINYGVIPAYARLSVANGTPAQALLPPCSYSHNLVLPLPNCARLQGVDVILLGGSTAEWPSLTSEERLDLLSAWRRALDSIEKGSRPQLLFHAGDTSIALSREGCLSLA